MSFSRSKLIENKGVLIPCFRNDSLDIGKTLTAILLKLWLFLLFDVLLCSYLGSANSSHLTDSLSRCIDNQNLTVIRKDIL